MAGPIAESAPPPPTNKDDHGSGGRTARNLVVTALGLLGGALLLRKLSKSTPPWDHPRKVSDALVGEKFSTEQATQDPETYFNLRLNACPAAELADGSRIIYVEQAFWRTPDKPYRQRFLKVKPCPKDVKCDVEVSSYAVRDAEEYKNFCERPGNQRPQPEEISRDLAEHLTTIHLSHCGQGEQCLYKGSTPPGGFPNSWNGATSCTSDLVVFKDGEIHCWDRGFNDEGAQVWGLEKGPYEFKPAASE
ncbi:hypothetical protein GOP47_0006258 [Adiantum capillus-veneris]|uniref:Chromophore lyase CRL, chloroplastic n=1 Tax=Adiantum capillus-veneris TaxID=13818 RepID=A0A9D4V3D3_ADICA|nr:hypothetical protein GOP47_0006258 [Adiantum capillus-veneris]